MKNEIKLFGFKTLTVNGFNVYTCNLKIADTDKDFTSLQQMGIVCYKGSTLVGKKGKQRSKDIISISFATLSMADYDAKYKAISLWLEEEYISRIKQKYAHLHPAEELIETPYFSEDLDF